MRRRLASDSSKSPFPESVYGHLRSLHQYIPVAAAPQFEFATDSIVSIECIGRYGQVYPVRVTTILVIKLTYEIKLRARDLSQATGHAPGFEVGPLARLGMGALKSFPKSNELCVRLSSGVNESTGRRIRRLRERPFRSMRRLRREAAAASETMISTAMWPLISLLRVAPSTHVALRH